MATEPRRSPLQAVAARLAAASGDDLQLGGEPFRSQIGLRVDPDARAARAAGRALGLDLPLVPNTVARAGSRSVLWLGPDEWLVVGPAGGGEALLPALREAVGADGSVVELSANRVAVTVSGPLAIEVLATCCRLDLHPSVFGTGRCAGTLVGGSQAIVEQTDDAPSFALYVRPSFLADLVEWLVAGAEELRAEHSAPWARPRRGTIAPGE